MARKTARRTVSKWLMAGVALVLLTTACRRGQLPQHTFQVEVMLPTTPVKNQGNSSLCWVYAMLATIETNHIGVGDSVNLSPHYLGRSYLLRQATAHRGDTSAWRLTTRGVAPMALSLLREEGVVPVQSFRVADKTDWKAIEARKRPGDGQHLQAMLDTLIGQPPLFVFMNGCEYTTGEFGRSLCSPGEYVSVTSLGNLPWGAEAELPVTDNFFHEQVLNLPIDSLAALTARAVGNGHAVCWEGDTSERGFSHHQGLAVLTGPARTPSQQERQSQIDSGHTTDDHCMAIVGLAHDERGERYFICKNSWGTQNPYGGFVYMSFGYFLNKTICIVLPSADLGA